MVKDQIMTIQVKYTYSIVKGTVQLKTSIGLSINWDNEISDCYQDPKTKFLGEHLYPLWGYLEGQYRWRYMFHTLQTTEIENELVVIGNSEVYTDLLHHLNTIQDVSQRYARLKAIIPCNSTVTLDRSDDGHLRIWRVLPPSPFGYSEDEDQE